QIDETPAGALQEGIHATFAAYDNAMRRERTTLGMQARIGAKGWPFQAAIGYRKVRHHVVGPTLEQDPARAPMIRESFELVATGLYPPAEVLRRVTLHGLRTLKGHPLSSQSFSDMLRKPIYA